MYGDLANPAWGPDQRLESYKDIEIMDTIRFTDDVVGKAPVSGNIVEVSEGTEGVVIGINSEGHFKIEVPSPESTVPLCFVEVDYDLIALIEFQ